MSSSTRRRSTSVKAGRDCVLLEAPRRAMLKLVASVESVRRQIDETFLKRAVHAYLAPMLPQDELDTLVATGAQVRRYGGGETIFSEGQAADGLYLIRRGSVTVSRTLAGREVVLSYLSAGNYVGEMALLSESPRMATVRAAAATECVVLDAAVFKDVLSRNPGAEIIYDVKCTALLGPWIERHGGKPVVWKTGHSFIKAKLKESGAALAGEMSGHIFFKERWYGFDDALYAGARLLEILAPEANASDALNALPNAPSTPELNWKLAEGEPHALVAKLQQARAFPRAKRVLTIDGVRAEYADGFGLARASNTTPVIVLRFEGTTKEALKRIQEEFRKALQPMKPDVPLPF